MPAGYTAAKALQKVSELQALAKQHRQVMTDLIEFKNAWDIGAFQINPGSDPVTQISDDKAQSLGFHDASVMQSYINDYLQKVKDDYDGGNGPLHMSAFISK